MLQADSVSTPPSSRYATWLLLAAVAFVGAAHIAFLPPWEGFDEYAHWSSIQQIADTGTLPHFGRDKISMDVESYRGPMPYGSGTTTSFDDTGRETYRIFKERGAPPLDQQQARNYQPGRELNWQAQHPPLFYVLLAPVYLATKNLALVHHLLFLRLTAWAFAFAGLAIGTLATVRIAGGDNPRLGPLMAAFPFFVPQFIPEMARLGNDSLCLFFMGIVWALTLTLIGRVGRLWHGVLLGLVLGLGLLTKAFFLPITVGVCALLAVFYLRTRLPSHARDLGVVSLVAVFVGGWWYVRNFELLGSVVGANYFLLATPTFDFWAGLLGNFSTIELLRGLAVMAGTFSWAGTWSLARLPEPLIALPLLLVGGTLGNWMLRLRSSPFIAWAPIFIAGPIVAGLLIHLLYLLAMTGRSVGTPAWYLHIAAAPVSFAMALGWQLPRLYAALACGSAAVSAIAWMLQLSLFSGCSTKTGMIKYYSFAGSNCVIDFATLSVLAFPGLAAACLALSGLCTIGALRMLHYESSSPRT